MFEQIYSQKLQVCLSTWTLFWKICIKNQGSSKATESKGLFPNFPSGVKGLSAN